MRTGSVCRVRVPSGKALDDAGCNVSGCSLEVARIIEVGGGNCVTLMRLCDLHAREIALQIEAEKPHE